MDCNQKNKLRLQKFKAAIKEAAFVKLVDWKKNIVQIGNGQVYREAQVLDCCFWNIGGGQRTQKFVNVLTREYSSPRALTVVQMAN